MKTAIERAIGVWRGPNNGVEYGGAYATQQIRNAIQEAMDEAHNEALEKAVYAAWGALPVTSQDAQRVAQAIRALKVGE